MGSPENGVGIGKLSLAAEVSQLLLKDENFIKAFHGLVQNYPGVAFVIRYKLTVVAFYVPRTKGLIANQSKAKLNCVL